MGLPKRKPTRLGGYDYSNQGYNFVTICTHNKKAIFADMSDNSPHAEIKLNEYGIIAESELLSIPNRHEDVGVDKYVIMPDHIHAIIIIGCKGEAERSRPFPTLSTIIGLYKSGVSKRIHEIKLDMAVWQKSFNDRIIRDEIGYQEVYRYINDNVFL